MIMTENEFEQLLIDNQVGYSVVTEIADNIFSVMLYDQPQCSLFSKECNELFSGYLELINTLPGIKAKLIPYSEYDSVGALTYDDYLNDLLSLGHTKEDAKTIVEADFGNTVVLKIKTFKEAEHDGSQK